MIPTTRYTIYMIPVCTDYERGHVEETLVHSNYPHQRVSLNVIIVSAAMFLHVTNYRPDTMIGNKSIAILM